MAQFLNSNLKRISAAELSADDNGPALEWIFDLKGLRIFLDTGIRLDQSDLFAKVKVPSLLVKGGTSRHVTDQEVQMALQLNPKLKTTTVPQAGHWLHVDNLDGTLNALLDFFKTIQ